MSARLLESEVVASRVERPELMADHGSTFTAAELKRLLDWFQGLRLCHGDVPRDYELADKIAFELAKPSRPVEQP